MTGDVPRALGDGIEHALRATRKDARGHVQKSLSGEGRARFSFGRRAL